MSSGRDEMMSRWDDEARMKQVELAATDIDDYFMILANKYELSASALNGILLARLLRLNMELKNEDNLYKLLEVVMKKEHETWDRSVH